MQTVTAAVVGASGYSGLELTRLLARHPHLRPIALLSDRWAGELAGDRIALGGPAERLCYDELAKAATVEADVAFLATPAEVSLAIAPRLLERGIQVVDLSGAFRLADASAYKEWYGFEHDAPALLAEARYGLPELARTQLAGARLITNPGCYATAIAMALAPLVASGLVEPDGIAVSALSGVSGAGRKASEDFSFCEVDEDLRAYRVGRHQHVPEIEQTVARFAGKCGAIAFTPVLVPIRRGILATCTLRLARGATASEISRVYHPMYGHEHFVRLLPVDKVLVKDVVRTNRVHLGTAVDARAGAVMAVCAIDNLVKGAAGQAIQALNAARGWSESLGLDLVGG